MKSKVKPMLSMLREICNGLNCLIRANSDVFYAAFCPSKKYLLGRTKCSSNS